MNDRLIELLLKAVRQLPEPEQDEVMSTLLSGALPLLGPLGSTAVDRPAIDPLPIEFPPDAVPTPATPRSRAELLLSWPMITGSLNTVAALSTQVSSDADTELKVLPVRLPVADYDRLRAFSREHGFSMAVIIRTLVERFLDERGTRPADEPPAPPG